MLEIYCSGKELPLSSAHFLKYFKASRWETLSVTSVIIGRRFFPQSWDFRGLLSVDRLWVVLVCSCLMIFGFCLPAGIGASSHFKWMWTNHWFWFLVCIHVSILPPVLRSSLDYSCSQDFEISCCYLSVLYKEKRISNMNFFLGEFQFPSHLSVCSFPPFVF